MFSPNEILFNELEAAAFIFYFIFYCRVENATDYLTCSNQPGQENCSMDFLCIQLINYLIN